MKWTESQQLLLALKIIEQAPTFTVNAEKIIETWPQDSEKPTVRAIKDRFSKMKKQHQTNKITHNFKISKSVVGGAVQTEKNQDQDPDSVPKTPQNRKSIISGICSSGKKRKRDSKQEEDEEMSSLPESDSEASTIQTSAVKRIYPTRITPRKLIPNIDNIEATSDEQSSIKSGFNSDSDEEWTRDSEVYSDKKTARNRRFHAWRAELDRGEDDDLSA